MAANKKARIVIYIVIAAVVALLGMSGLFIYTGQPSFCASCHEMATVHASWQYSTHGKVAKCLDCHAKPGLGNEIIAHLNGARYLWSKVTGQSKGKIFKAKIANVSCLKCHSRADLANIPAEENIQHKPHLNRGVDCDDCHENLVHRTFRAISKKPPLAVCENCHIDSGVVVSKEKLSQVSEQL